MINLALISNLAYPFFDPCSWCSESSRAVPGDYFTVTLVHGRLSCPYLPPPTAQRNQIWGLCFKFCSIKVGINPSSGFPWMRWNSLSSPTENTDVAHKIFPVQGTCHQDVNSRKVQIKYLEDKVQNPWQRQGGICSYWLEFLLPFFSSL